MVQFISIFGRIRYAWLKFKYKDLLNCLANFALNVSTDGQTDK